MGRCRKTNCWAVSSSDPKLGWLYARGGSDGMDNGVVGRWLFSVASVWPVGETV